MSAAESDKDGSVKGGKPTMSAAESDKEAMSATQTIEQPTQDVLQIESNSNKMQTFSGSTKPSDRMDTDLSYAEVVKQQGVPFNKKSYDKINTSFEQDDRDGGLNKHSFQGDREWTELNNKIFRTLNRIQGTEITRFYFRRKKDRKQTKHDKMKKRKMIFC